MVRRMRIIWAGDSSTYFTWMSLCNPHRDPLYIIIFHCTEGENEAQEGQVSWSKATAKQRWCQDWRNDSVRLRPCVPNLLANLHRALGLRDKAGEMTRSSVPPNSFFKYVLKAHLCQVPDARATGMKNMAPCSEDCIVWSTTHQGLMNADIKMVVEVQLCRRPQSTSYRIHSHVPANREGRSSGLLSRKCHTLGCPRIQSIVAHHS